MGLVLGAGQEQLEGRIAVRADAIQFILRRINLSDHNLGVASKVVGDLVPDREQRLRAVRGECSAKRRKRGNGRTTAHLEHASVECASPFNVQTKLDKDMLGWVARHIVKVLSNKHLDRLGVPVLRDVLRLEVLLRHV